MDRHQAFQQLKQRGVELIQATSSFQQQPTKKKEIIQSLTRLLDTLRRVSATPGLIDAKLAEFVFAPISQVLRISGLVPVRALEVCLECVATLLQTGWKEELSAQLSGQFLILFTFLANPSSADNGIPVTSEELQAGAFRCMTALFSSLSSSSQGRQSLTETANIPSLGKAVLVIVDSLAENKSNDVRLQAAFALQSLISAVDDADALASFLPRMVSALNTMLTPHSTYKASFRLLEKGLMILSFLFERLLDDTETKDLPAQSQKDDLQNQEKVLRTTSWLQATTIQIRVVLANVFKLRNHDKNEVRQALLKLCLVVIRNCRHSLANCTAMAVETLVFLAGSSGGTNEAKNELRSLLFTEDSLSDLLRESLYGWILSLPRLMQGNNDEARKQLIHQIAVALRLLNGEQFDLSRLQELLAGNLRDGVSAIFNASKELQSLVAPISAPLAEDVIASGETGATHFNPIKLRLKGQDDMMEEFGFLLQEIAKSSSAVMVAQDLVTALECGSEENRIPSLWTAVNLVKEMVRDNAGINDLVNIGTSDGPNDLLNQLYAYSLSVLTASTVNDHSTYQLQALALEAVAMYAQQYGLDFRGELIEALYPVLHLLGSADSMLRNHAITCLNIIAKSCGYNKASDLVVSNVDYVVNSVGVQLNSANISPQVPLVLLMTLRLCGPSLLPFLDDLVGSIFSALERYHGYPKLVELLFLVLKGMAEEGIKAPQLMITGEDKVAHVRQLEPTRVAELINILSELRKDSLKPDVDHIDVAGDSFPRRPWKAEEDLDSEHTPSTDHDDSENQINDPPEQPPPAPRTFDILVKITDLTQHYLTSDSPSLRRSLLSLLHTTIPALAKHENSFLPLINTLWPVLLPRLEDGEAYVVSNALDTIALMCAYAGNFMKSRVEGIWNLLKSIHKRTVIGKGERKGGQRMISANLNILATGNEVLNRIATSELTQTQDGFYVDAPSRMTWNSLVALLSTVARHVSLREEFVDDIFDMLDPVLGQADVRTALMLQNSDALWLREYRSSNLSSGKGHGEASSRPGEPPRYLRAPADTSQWSFVQLQAR